MKRLYHGVINRRLRSRVSFSPLDPKTCHPVYSAHARILQPKTAPIFLRKTVHVIGRPKEVLLKNGYHFISELEGAAGFAPTSLSKDRYDISAAVDYTDRYIKAGRLKALIYQSEEAYKLHAQSHSNLMDEISHVITQVPYRHEWAAKLKGQKKLRVLMIASNPIAKGLFLLERLCKSLCTEGIPFEITVVAGRKFEIDAENVSVVVTPRLTPETKSELFSSHHVLLNISPMDTLGTYLDSMQFGVPLVTVRGQHAPDYIVNNESGIYLEQPVFYYSDKLGTEYTDVKNTFTQYLLSLGENTWTQMLEDVTAALFQVWSNFDRFIDFHRNYVSEHHSIEKWVRANEALYESL